MYGKKHTISKEDIIKQVDKTKVFVDNRRLQAYLIKQSVPGMTNTTLAELMDVSPSSIDTWLRDMRSKVDETGLIEATKKRLAAMVIPATNVYNRAIEQGQVKADFVSLSAAKDILKNKGIIQDKVTIEHTIKSKDDKDLTDELAVILEGYGRG